MHEMADAKSNIERRPKCVTVSLRRDSELTAKKLIYTSVVTSSAKLNSTVAIGGTRVSCSSTVEQYGAEDTFTPQTPIGLDKFDNRPVVTLPQFIHQSTTSGSGRSPSQNISGVLPVSTPCHQVFSPTYKSRLISTLLSSSSSSPSSSRNTASPGVAADVIATRDAFSRLTGLNTSGSQMSAMSAIQDISNTSTRHHDVMATLSAMDDPNFLQKNNLVNREMLNKLTAAVDWIKKQLPTEVTSNEDSGEGRATIAAGDVTSESRSLDQSGADCPAASGTSQSQEPPQISSRRRRHRRRHGSSHQYVCNQCQEPYPSVVDLSEHTKEVHGSYKCTLCSTTFTKRSTLLRHSFTHIDFKPYICKLCNKGYCRKENVFRHINERHPSHDPKANLTVKLTQSECLEYLERTKTESKLPQPGGSEVKAPDGDVDSGVERRLVIDLDYTGNSS